MGKKRSNYNLDGTPVTNPNATTDFDNSNNLVTQSRLYSKNAGAQDVGGRYKKAGFANDYFEEKVLGFSTGEVTDGYSKMGTGTFDPFKTDNDFEKIRKDNQSTAVASVNLMGQFVAKTAINTVGGIIGGFYSIGSAVANQDMSKMVDNSFLRGLDKASESVDKNASVFTSQADKDNGAFGMFSGLETMKSVSDAFAFTTGAILTEVAMQSVGNLLTGGAAAASTPGRAIRYVAGIGKLLSTENKIGRGIAKAADVIGVGNNLRKIGADAELVSAFIRNADNTAEGARLMQKAAMTEGMGMDALQKYNGVARAFELTGSGVRKVITGSMYEGSLEGRQAYDSMMQNAEVTIDAQMESEGIGRSISDPEKRQLVIDTEKQKRLAMAQTTAKSMMFQVMAANVGLLAASNAIQFPALFGVKSFSPVKGMNTNSKAFTRNLETGLAEQVKNSTAQNIASKTASVLKSPFTEFMEETLQGAVSKTSQNYHERLTQTKSHTGGMEHPIAEFTSSMIKAMKTQYGEKEGIEEGLIGAIVGAIGGPGFKRNKNGKIRPTMQGGVLDAFKGESAEQKKAIQEVLDVLNSSGQLNSLKYNLEQSKMNSFSANEKNKAETSGNKKAYESINTDEIFQHVSNYLDKGLKDHYLEEKKSLKEMSPEEYTLKTQGEGVPAISAEQKEKELDAYFEKADAYAEAYEKVYTNMKMDKMDDNPLNKKLLSHLAYAIAKDKTELAEFDAQSLILQSKGLKMSPRELYKLAKSHNKLNTFTRAELEAEIKSLTSDAARNFVEDYKDSATSFRDEFKEKGLSKASMKKAIALIGKLEGSQDMKSAMKEIARLENMGSQGVKVPLSTMRTRDVVMGSEAYKKAKERFTQENLEAYSTDFIKKNEEATEKKNMRANIRAAKRFQSNQSQVMDQLAGKEPRMLGLDIQEYLETMDKFKGQLTEEETVPKLFIDQLDSKGTEDINTLLEELAETVGRRETSLRIAANLYGLTGANRALANIARAELIANFKNNQYYRQALAYFLKNGSRDDSGAEEAIAFKKLELSLISLKDNRDKYQAMLEADEDNNDEAIEEVLKTLNSEISISDQLLEFYKEEIAVEEARERADEISNKKKTEQTVETVVSKIEKKILADSEEDVAEALELENLMLQHGELVNAPKLSLDIYSSTDSDKQQRDGGLSQLIEDGLIQRGNIVYLRPKADFDLSEETESVMSPQQVILYKKGQALFEADSSKIADEEFMNPEQFMTDGVLDLVGNSDKDEAALQYFVMTYKVNKEITNDKNFKGESGKNKIIQQEGDARIMRDSFLYSPYFAFEKDKKQAENLRDILNHDIKSLEEMNSALNNPELTKIQKLQLKAKINLLEVSVKARALKANDATLYELRKKILLGLMMHNKSSEKEESYAMLTYVTDFNYGKISEHTVDGKEKDFENFNKFPVLNVKESSVNFDETDHFLTDSESAEDLFNKDKIYICFQNHELKSVKTGAAFKFNSGQLSTGAENDTNEKEELLPEGVEKTQKKYSVGSMYYMHETATGITVPVKLSMNKLGDNKDIMDGLKKYITQAVESAKEKQKDKSKKFKLYDEPIVLEQGDFNGLFDNDTDKPTTIHKLLTYFAPVMNNPRELSLGKMVKSIGEKEDANQEEEDYKKTEDEFLDDNLELSISAVPDAKTDSKQKVVKVHFDFSTSERTIEEMNDEAIEDIMNNIGQMRFYFKKNLSVNASKKGSEGNLAKPNVFEFAFASGMISHGFETNLNREKIYPKTNVKTVMVNGEIKESVSDKQVSMSIKPIDDNVLTKTRNVLKNYYGKPKTNEKFFDTLKNLFNSNTKWDKENKSNFDYRKVSKQIVYMTNDRFKKILKESLKKNPEPTKVQRASMFKEAVEAQTALFNLELKTIEERITNPSGIVILKHIQDLVKKFEAQYKDAKNSRMFEAIYMFKAENEYYDELNNLLFLSSEVNNNLTEVMPTVTLKKDTDRPSVSPSSFKIDKKFLNDFYAAIEDHQKLSGEHASISGNKNGGLPLDIEVSTIRMNPVTKKLETEKKRTTPLLDADGMISSKGSGVKKVYLDGAHPLKIKDASGKFIDLTKDHIEGNDLITFDKETGKMLTGRIFMLVSNLDNKKGNTFVEVATGLDEFSSVNIKDTSGNLKAMKYLTGINFYKRNSDMTINTKEQNLIEGMLSKAGTAKVSATDVVDKVALGPKREASWEEEYDSAMNALDEYNAMVQDVESNLNKIRGVKTAPQSSLFDNIDDDRTPDQKSEAELQQEALNEIAASRTNSLDTSFLIGDRVNDQDDFDMDYYDENVVLEDLFNDRNLVKIDFTKLSDKEFIAFVNENLNQEATYVRFIKEAFEEDSVRTKKEMNALALKTIIVENATLKAKGLSSAEYISPEGYPLITEKEKPKVVVKPTAKGQLTQEQQKDLYNEKQQLLLKLESFVLETGNYENGFESNLKESEDMQKRIREINPQIMGYKPDSKKTSLTNIAADEDDSSRPVGKEKKTVNNSLNSKVFQIDGDYKVSLTGAMVFEDKEAVEIIGKQLKENNSNLSDSDIFASMIEATQSFVDGKILFNSEVLMIGEAILKEDESAVKAKLKEYNDTCGVPF